MMLSESISMMGSESMSALGQSKPTKAIFSPDAHDMKRTFYFRLRRSFTVGKTN